MEVREVSRPTIKFWSFVPGLNCSGVLEFLPNLTAERYTGGGGNVGFGWIFWSFTLEWRVP